MSEERQIFLIFKLFDQILRPLVYQLLRLAGMPRQIVDAYGRFLEAMITYNIIAGGVGRAQKRRCGIPQGCPPLYDGCGTHHAAMGVDG